jgi:DNA-binding MarR family transcriptional regulator
MKDTSARYEERPTSEVGVVTAGGGEGYGRRVAEPSRLRSDPIAEAARQWASHGWGDAALGMSVVTSVVRAQQLFSARIDHALAPYGLTFARYEILTLLSFSRAGALPIGKVGERLQVHGTSVTSAVERLEKQDFVQRRRHPDDGRAVLIHITDAGRAVVAQTTPVLNEAVFETIELSDTQQTQLYKTLRALRRSAGDFA